ncbi:MAG TPA: AAA family ATPase [Myxococcaceae bacterium]|nr:AAA family ATPase [Myxococcaceae bacterium]
MAKEKQELTPTQATQQLEALGNKVNALEAGPAGPPAPKELTFPEIMNRANGLLSTVDGHLTRAKEREARAEQELKRLQDQRRDQEEKLKEQQRQTDADLASRKKDLDWTAQEQKRREDVLAAREAEVSARADELATKQAALVKQESRLTEREANAEREFTAEKARVLAPLQGEVEQLRRRATELQAEIDRKEAERASRDSETRRALDAELARERQKVLEKTRTEAAAELAKIESARRQELDALEKSLSRQRGELHAQQQNLRIEQELLAENQLAVVHKVERMVAERTEDLRHDRDSLRQQLEDARKQRDAHFREVESRRELDRQFGDRTPAQILDYLRDLERKHDDLAQQLRYRPGAAAAARLDALEKERSAWLEERAALQGDLAKAKGELATRRLAAIDLETVRREKEMLETNNRLLANAAKELDDKVTELTRQDSRDTAMKALVDLDQREDLQTPRKVRKVPRGKPPVLKDFLARLRHQVARGVEGRTLYYSERDLRAFVGGLAMTRLLLLQGISGTGKTSLPLAFAQAVGGEVEIVPVQAGWRDRQDLVGYYNAFHRHYYATDFLQALYRAGTPACSERLFVIVLDEINLSRPEQFFADFLSALEQPLTRRRLTLVSDPIANPPRLLVDGKHLPIPPNVWFVGTANHDETTVEFADKTYDRAQVLEMPRVNAAAQFKVDEALPAGDPLSYPDLERAFGEAVETHKPVVDQVAKWLESALFAGALVTRFRVGWGNRPEQQLSRYLPVVVEAGGTAGEALDHLLATKVLRRLKDRHDVQVSALEELRDLLKADWTRLSQTLQSRQPEPTACLDLLAREIALKQGAA